MSKEYIAKPLQTEKNSFILKFETSNCRTLWT